MAVMLGSWVLFTVLADLLVLPRLGLPPLPDATWLVGILVLLPLLSFLGISVNVLISTKVSDVRVAQQYGALLVMPIVLFFSLSTGGAVFLGPEFLLAVAAVVGGLDVLVFLLTRVLFGREEILTKWK
jgi:ABC-2 type transport system permease protein